MRLPSCRKRWRCLTDLTTCNSDQNMELMGHMTIAQSMQSVCMLDVS
jgi:hypothetical protein